MISKKNRALSRVLKNILRADTVRENPAKQETQAPPNAPAYSLPTDIPKSYDDTYVRAIPKDPQNTFVYWEMPKEVTRVSVFPDKGTAHVGNDEVVRVQEQLRHNANNHRQQHDDNNNQWQDNNNLRQDNNNQQQNDNRRWLDENSHWLNNTKFWPDDNHSQRQDGNRYRQDDNHWQDDNRHRQDDNHWQDNNQRQDNNHQRQNNNLRHDDNRPRQTDTLSAMLDNLITQCGRYIDECKGHEYTPSPSSGEFCKAATNTETQP